MKLRRKNDPISGWTSIVSCIVLSACAGSRSSPSTGAPANSREGVYEFSATVPAYEPGKTLHLQGTLTVLGDSLLIQSPNSCTNDPEHTRVFPRGMPYTPGAKGFYNCGSVWLAFPGRDPVKSAMWYASVPVPKQRNACVEYRMNDARRQVCVRYRPETYYEYQIRSGAIQVRPIQ